MKSKTQSVYAKYGFSSDELVQITFDLANKCQEKDTIEDEKKSITSSLTSQVASVQAEINRLSTNYRQGYEYRNIECEIVLDEIHKIRKYLSVATGLVVKEEPFLSEDY